MELRHLRSFVAVAEELHFGRAADRLHIAQSALSQHIAQLERQIATRLFERTTRRVELNDAGQVFYERATRLLADAVEAVEQAQRTARGMRGWVTVGFVDSAAYGLLPPLLRALGDQLPDVAVDLRELATERDLETLRDKVDVGIVREVDEVEGLTITPLLTEPLVAALPRTHRLADHDVLSLADLAGEPFVLFPRERVPLVYDHLIRLCHAVGFRPQAAQHALQYPTMLSLVSAGYGVALVPAAVSIVSNPGVRYVRLRDRHATSQLSLAARVDNPLPALARVRTIALEVAGGLAGA